MLTLKEKDLDRFWDKIDKTNDCWNWTAATTTQGYGRFKLNGKLVSAHVLSYMIHNDDYDSTKDVCHKCDNPSCVNPDHLFLGSRSDNMLDCLRKGRLNSKPPCVKGERNGQSKLTVDDVIAIKALLKTSVTQKSIAQMFNVSPRAISDINNNKTWAHIK